MQKAGSLDRLVQFRARGAATQVATRVFKRDFADLGSPVWASFKAGTPFRLFVGDMKIQLPAGTLTVRRDPFTETISAAHRVVLDEGEFLVRSVNPLARNYSTIDIDVMSANGPSAYAEDFDRDGEVIVIRRVGATPEEITARAKVTGYNPDELVGGIDQGDRRVTVLAADVIAEGFVDGIQENDSIFVRGKRMNVQDVDDSTHRVAGELLAYLLTVRG